MSEGSDHLITGEGNHLLDKLLSAINAADRIYIGVAFIRQTGLSLIIESLRDTLTSDTPAKLQILTGDYLEVTEPESLRELMVLSELGAEVKIFESKKTSFHLKAYIFLESNDEGQAFIGSSNVSRIALTSGIEWNLRIKKTENVERFNEVEQKFQDLFNHKKSIVLNHDWIDEYQNRYESKIDIAKTVPVIIDVLPAPTPYDNQIEALDALHATRAEGFKRGLVVLASGMGKTYLSAFDAKAIKANRVLFVAHRDEILDQAERSFIRIMPNYSVGRYTGKKKELNVNMVFASVQTLGKAKHLNKFEPDYFDYIVVDEFHHAAAKTYRQLLDHFDPKFLLGLTATPARTDQADILLLCDNNLVYSKDLFDGINSVLCPFHYYGIGDDSVDYQEIPWRNGKFDPEKLTNQLATQARAKSVLKKWQELKQTRTLAFCISIKHADFMSEYFNRHGLKTVSAHSKSQIKRTEALSLLASGELDVIFSVDLFNEGVDIPSVDTVLMLRPTESKIVFLQQLGRGLRQSETTQKEKLVVLDYIGNHISFFKKAEALLNIDPTNAARRKFIEEAENEELELPDGCFVNYDLTAIDFLKGLVETKISTQIDVYRSLKESLNRRPQLVEFSTVGKVSTVRTEFGQWFGLVDSENDFLEDEKKQFSLFKEFLRDIETTPMTKCFKMILLEAFVGLGGFNTPISIDKLSIRSHEIINRKRALIGDLPKEYTSTKNLNDKTADKWTQYWIKNPIAAWTGKNTKRTRNWFELKNNEFSFTGEIPDLEKQILNTMVLELVSYRIYDYEKRGTVEEAPVVIDIPKQQIPYFSDLKIACGHFKDSEHEQENIEYKNLPLGYGNLSPETHFIARAKGDSMNGGKNPILDGDHLLLELVTTSTAGSISNQIMALERQSETGDDEYLLRRIEKNSAGEYNLVAQNIEYPDLLANELMKPFARLKTVLEHEDMLIHQSMMKEEVAGNFGLEYLEGRWKMPGYLIPKDGDGAQFVFVTLDKQQAEKDYKYHDYFRDASNFHWQSQKNTSPTSIKGEKIINHESNNDDVHLFVRKFKKINNKKAPFIYLGKLTYKSHKNSKPMDVEWELQTPLSDELVEYFGTFS